LTRCAGVGKAFGRNDFVGRRLADINVFGGVAVGFRLVFAVRHSCIRVTFRPGLPGLPFAAIQAFARSRLNVPLMLRRRRRHFRCPPDPSRPPEPGLLEEKFVRLGDVWRLVHGTLVQSPQFTRAKIGVA
jgi:hypothetical protein